MLPVFGPTPNHGQSQQPTIQNDSAGENEQTEEAEGETSKDSAAHDVKLDLGNSGNGDVHEKTAQLVLEKNVQIHIEQSVSVSTTVSQSSAAKGTDKQASAEVAAQRIIQHTESLFAKFSAQTKSSNAEALKQFKEKARQGIKSGFQATQKEIGNDPSQAINQLLEDVRTALDRYLATFGEDLSQTESQASKGNESTGNQAADNEQSSKTAPAQTAQNTRASEGRPAIPAGLARRVAGRSTAAETLTNFAG